LTEILLKEKVTDASVSMRNYQISQKLYNFFLASFHTVVKISNLIYQNMENSSLQVHQD